MPAPSSSIVHPAERSDAPKPPLRTDVADARPQGPWVPIRTLQPRHRARIAEHLRLLPPHDRFLRFGYQPGDAQIDRYVESIDFDRDEVFGIFNRRLALIAVAHLAHMPPGSSDGAPSIAEFGVSVLPHARRRRLGGRLFAHAVLHARNRGVDTLLIHALSENGTMLRIAARAGATVVRTGSEAEAFLRLPPETIASCFDEVLELHAAELDFQLKRHARHLSMFWDSVVSPAPVDRNDDAPKA